MNLQDIQNLFTLQKKHFFKVARKNELTIIQLKKYVYNIGFACWKGDKESFFSEIRNVSIKKYFSPHRIRKIKQTNFSIIEVTNEEIINTFLCLHRATAETNIKKHILEYKQENKSIDYISIKLCLSKTQIYNILKVSNSKHNRFKNKDFKKGLSKKELELEKVKDFEKTFFPGRIITEKTRLLLQKYGKLEKYENKKASF